MAILDIISNRNKRLPSAQFEIFRCHRSVVASNLSSGTEGEIGSVFFTSKLPLGTYYVHETNVPDGYDSTKTWWTLTVNKDGTFTFTRPSATEP